MSKTSREGSNEPSSLPSLPPIHLPGQFHRKDIMVAQTRTRDRPSSNVSTKLSSLSQNISHKVPEAKNTLAHTISSNQSCKEKKRLVIKRKKITDNRISDTPENYEKRPKKDKTSSSTIRQSGLQQIDIFAPKENRKEANEKKRSSCLSSSREKPQTSEAIPSTDLSKLRKLETNEDCPSDNSAESEVLPPSRIRKTVHTPFRAKNREGHTNNLQCKPSVSSARQRMRDNWQKTSIDSQNHEIELLNKSIKDLESNHEEQMRLKAEKFEKWITQKENALEHEKREKIRLQEKFEQTQVKMVGLQKQLEQQQQSYKNLEEMLVENINTNHKLSHEKNEAEKSLANAKQELEESNNSLASKNDEMSEVHKKIDEQDDKVSDLELSIGEKDDEIKQLNKSQENLKIDYEKQLSRLQKQLDYQKDRTTKLNEEKRNKIKENKEATAELKKKDELIAELLREKNNLNEEVSKCKALSSKSSQLKAENSDLVQEHNAKDDSRKFDELEKQNKSLLDSLDRLQKIMTGFETVIDEKNKNIAELNSKYEDSENNLDQAMQTLNELKESEKQKKDYQKQIKKLQTTLKDWETRQISNLKLISGLQKKNSELEKKLINLEENSSGSDAIVHNYTTKIDQLERECKLLKDQCNTSDKELAEKDSRLKSRIEEVESLKAKVASCETEILQLERAMRTGSTESSDVQQLALQIKNKDGEVMHLRKTLDNLKIQLRQASINHEGQLNEAKKAKELLEVDCSRSLLKVEEFKKILSEAENNILHKENELNFYKKAVNEENIAKLRPLLQIPGNQDQTAEASKVVVEMMDAISKINSGMCYNLNDQPYLVKSEPVDDTDESFNLNQLSSGSSNRINPFSPQKQMAQINTDEQIILNVPSVSNTVVSERNRPPVYDDLSSTIALHNVMKQEPGKDPFSVPPHLPSQVSRNLCNDTKFPKKAVDTTIKAISQLQGTHEGHAQSLRQPVQYQSSYTNHTSHLQTSRFVKSTSSVNPHAPINSQIIVPYGTNIIEESSQDQMHKDGTTESDESDAGLDDFFPQADPLSGLTFVNKNIISKPSTPDKEKFYPKASTSLKDTKKSPSSKLEDFTGKYAEEEEESYTCGICNQFDPPDQSSITRYTTEWVGCDCERWFHKPCTKMKKFMKSFSCKSVKMKCLPKVPIPSQRDIELDKSPFI